MFSVIRKIEHFRKIGLEIPDYLSRQAEAAWMFADGEYERGIAMYIDALQDEADYLESVEYKHG